MTKESSTGPVKKKTKSSLPVYVVEDHNDALAHIYRAIGSKKLPFNNVAMIHLDSHPDLLLPNDFDANRTRDKEYVLNCVSIATWILPAVFAGHINVVAWIKPPWADQMQDGVCKCKIGRHVETHKLKLSSPEPYFVSELLYAPEDEMVDSSDVTLIVQNIESDSASSSESDPSSQLVNNVSSQTKVEVNDDVAAKCTEVENFFKDQELRQVPFILDIDLDFYSTQNPFCLIFSDFQFQMLQELYRWDKPPKWKNSDEVKAAAKEREQQLDMLKNILMEEFDSSVSCPSTSTTSVSSECGAGDNHSTDTKQIIIKHKKLAHALIDDLKKVSNPEIPLNWKFIHEAGCTFDWSGLPHHVSNDKEIQNLVLKTKKLLETLPKPSMVTIARSSYDDYCPKDQVNWIQQLVLSMLEELYGYVDVTLDYEEEEIPEGSAKPKDLSGKYNLP